MKPAELLADSKSAEKMWTPHILFDILKNMQGNDVILRTWRTNEYISIQKNVWRLFSTRFFVITRF